MALNEFEGTVMLVSHDRALLREVCDEFWLVAGGVVKPFDGDLDDYQRWLLEQSRAASREQTRSDKAKKQQKPDSVAPAPLQGSTMTARADPTAKGKDGRKAGAATRQRRADETKPLKKELNLVDNRLGVLFAEREALEAAFSAATMSAAELADSGKRLKAIADQIESLEARWLELGTRLDELAEPEAR